MDFKRDLLNRKRKKDIKITKLLKVENEKRTYIEVNISAPSIIDLIENNVESSNFFKTIKEKIIGIYAKSQEIVIDLDLVTYLDEVTIILLIAYLEIIKLNRIRFHGSLPKNEELVKMLGRYGIQKFVYSSRSLVSNINTLSVECGNKVEAFKAAKLVEKVKRYYCFSQAKCEVLYNTIVELMDNTVNHAYTEYENQIILPKKWYISISNKIDYIDVIFVDIGLGIPNTIKKKFLSEELLSRRHCELIESTLKADAIRTSTSKINRGKGLKETFINFSKYKLIDDLIVISGKGVCEFTNENRFISNSKELLSDVNGTIIKWKLTKQEENDDIKHS